MKRFFIGYVIGIMMLPLALYLLGDNPKRNFQKMENKTEQIAEKSIKEIKDFYRNSNK